MIYLLLFLFPFAAHAVDAAPCGPGTKLNALCACELSELRPTQAAVGMMEVGRKQEKLAERKKKAKKLDKYLRKNPEPAVRGPGGKLYITDHHHLGRALLELDVASTYCTIDLDLSKLSEAKFWAEMKKRKLVYLFDENGKAISPEQLPVTIAKLKDDPYRSIAGQVREKGGFLKSKTPFSEFAWAQYFRSRIPKPKNKAEMLKAIDQAVTLSKKPEAKGLSGYVGD
jgi:hypothetical protein